MDVGERLSSSAMIMIGLRESVGTLNSVYINE
jgi:hypothetical protein